MKYEIILLHCRYEGFIRPYTLVYGRIFLYTKNTDTDNENDNKKDNENNNDKDKCI